MSGDGRLSSGGERGVDSSNKSASGVMLKVGGGEIR